MPVIRGNYSGKRICRCGKPATTIVQYIEEAMELAMETVHPVRVMCRPCAKKEVAPSLGLDGAAREIPGTCAWTFIWTFLRPGRPPPTDVWTF